MNTIAVLKNTIQEYAWGSETAIPELLGKSPSGKPQAEIWMGAHPKAPSKVVCNEKYFSLADLIDRYPREILGATSEYTELPYLLKILAAAKPLSVQAHPDIARAREGYKRENDFGIPLDAPNRNYRDANHKPECICALTSFMALKGFRKLHETIDLLKKLGPKGLENEIGVFAECPAPQGLKRFFETLMTLGGDRKKAIIADSVRKAERLTNEKAFEWLLLIHETFPDDIGILAPLLLNNVHLQPGQAVYLDSGELHSYLEGVAIEVMANSDNVLRGGLTSKHIDLPELMRILRFDIREIEILEPKPVDGFESVYETPAREFRLSVIALKNETAQFHNHSASILFCANGSASIRSETNPEQRITGGMSVIVPASVEKYGISGEALFYKSSVPV